MLDPYDVPWPSWRQFRAILGLLQLLLGFYDAVCNVFVFDSWLLPSAEQAPLRAWQPLLLLHGPRLLLLLLLGTDSPTRGGGGCEAWLLGRSACLALRHFLAWNAF